MEAFGIILDRILPIGAQRIVLAIGADEGRSLRGEGGDLGSERSGNRLEIRCRAVEIDEEETEEGAEPDGNEVEALLVEVHQMLGAARAAQGAREVIGPGVIGAGDGGGLQPAFAFEQPMGAVLADVEEAPDFAVPVAEQKHALIQYVADDMLPGSGASRHGRHTASSGGRPGAARARRSPDRNSRSPARCASAWDRDRSQRRGWGQSRSLVPPYVTRARA